jgi:hypothetical protein
VEAYTNKYKLVYSCGVAVSVGAETTETTRAAFQAALRARKTLGYELVRRHDVRVDVERHARPRVAGALGELACRNTRLMPKRDPTVPQVVRAEMRDARGLAGARERLVRARLGFASGGGEE